MSCTLIYVIFEQLNSPYSFQNRATGFTIHPNVLGHSVVVCLSLVIIGKKHHLIALGFIISLIIIWFSGSRAALVGLIPLLLYWFYTLPHHWKKLLFAVLLTLSLIGVWLGISGNLGRFATLFDPSDITTVSRLGIWNVAIHTFLQNPWQGGGLGSFPHYYSILGNELATDLFASHAHNIFLHLLAESGLLGCLGFLILLLVIFLLCWSSQAWLSITLLLSILLLNLADFTFFNAAIYYPFWITIAWETNRHNSHKISSISSTFTGYI